MDTEMMVRTVNQIAILSVPVIFLIVMVVTRGKYKNKSNAGAFFFEDNNLVLNTGIPYPIPFDDIECVELKYNSWQLEHQLSYGLSVKVIKKDGKTKRVFYTGYKTAKLAMPFDMEAALHEKGICCVMVNTQR